MEESKLDYTEFSNILTKINADLTFYEEKDAQVEEIYDLIGNVAEKYIRSDNFRLAVFSYL